VRSVTAETARIVYGTCALECNLGLPRESATGALGFGRRQEDLYRQHGCRPHRTYFTTSRSTGGTSKDGTPVLQFDTRTAASR
jgi:hypothetical protein